MLRKPAGGAPAVMGAAATTTLAVVASSWEGKVIRRTATTATAAMAPIQQQWVQRLALSYSQRLPQHLRQIMHQQRDFAFRSHCNSSRSSSSANSGTVLQSSIFSKVSRSFTSKSESAKVEAVAPTASSKSSGAGFLAWYEGHLNARPVVTKMVTGSFLWGIGDAVAQIVPHVAAGNPLPDYDWIRTGRATFFGFAIHAPLSHLHFNFLEWITVRSNVTGLGIPVFKAFLEQFVYWSWFSNSLYHGAMGAMQGLNATQIYDRIADVLWETQKAQWVFWIPIQLVNFQFTPVRHQLNVVLLTSIVWTALLSAWYPPQNEENEEKAELILEGVEKA